MKIIPVILSGGSGTRLWPLSREAYPKQLLKLVSDETLLQQTVTRLKHFEGVSAPVIVCNGEHRFLIAEQLREINVTPRALFLEPVARNTAPALAVAAHALLRDEPDALMLVLPADHLIARPRQFAEALKAAAAAAQAGKLVTFGVVPTGPETGYGYIERGAALEHDGAYAVARFIEKPDAARATEFVAQGSFYWNSGMFLFGAKKYLDELGKTHPDMVSCTAQALEKSYTDLDFCRLDEQALASCKSESIDYAVMEHTDSAAVVPVDIGWSDIGSWSALWEVSEKDDSGNTVRGDVYLDGSNNCLVRAESRAIAALGLDDVVIIETSDAILVAHKSKVQDVKKVVAYLKQNDRTEHLTHKRVFRPWGWYEGIDEGERFQVKRIMVKPGEKLSLQMHHHRAEHWIVVTGSARVTRGDEVTLLTENQSTYIPLGVTHRLENPGKVPLHLIEVQSGAYLGEDDIVRFQDTYGRAPV
mgnify:CR=1 FL=1